MNPLDEPTIPDGACSDLAEIVEACLVAVSPGKPTETDVYDACVWYVAHTAAQEMLEDYNVKDWAHLLRDGTNAIDMDYIADWYETRIQLALEDQWYDWSDDDLDPGHEICDQYRAEFWESEAARVRAHFGLPTQP